MTDPTRRPTDAVLRGALAGSVVTLDPSFQGLPETAHGGTVLALFDAASAVTGPRVVSGTYHRRVPLATSLSLAVDRHDGSTGLRLTDRTTLLVDGLVQPLDRPVEENGPAAAPSERDSSATPLPVSKTCFACGVENPLGLRARLSLDERHVRGTWLPHEAFRGADGALATVAVTTLLDEAAFWLGAAASGESGMTTELRVILYDRVPFDTPLTVAGARARVAARPDDPRYWETDIAAWIEPGRLVARARITFVAVRGAARKLVTGLLAVNPPATLRRVFPAYVR